MKAEILTIGDELLIGQIVNTNAAWIGERLDLVGIDVVGLTTVGDDIDIIARAVANAFRAAEAVVVTGGLGPTHDDVTKHAIAGAFGVPLRFDEPTYLRIRERFERRGRAMPESNRSQAMVPEGFDVIPNPAGTAPGLWYAGVAEGRRRLLAALPGVPHEMKRLMEDAVIPRLLEQRDLKVIRHRTLLTAGIGESTLQDRIGEISDLLGPELRLAYLPGSGGVRLRLTAYGEDVDDVERRLRRLEDRLRGRIDSFIYGADPETLEAVVGGLLASLGKTIAIAESCTGGHVANQITNVPGSSAYLLGGIIAYGNPVKEDQLGVDPRALETEGAVSEAVARQMAAGVRRRLGADIGLSTTGIAGPTGGSPEKPVGTVWIGYADERGDDAVHLRLAHDRILNKELTTTATLDLLRRRLENL